MLNIFLFSLFFMLKQLFILYIYKKRSTFIYVAFILQLNFLAFFFQILLELFFSLIYKKKKTRKRRNIKTRFIIKFQFLFKQSKQSVHKYDKFFIYS